MIFSQFWIVFFLIGVMVRIVTAAETTPSVYERDIHPLIVKYCLDCHDNDSSKGGLSLEPFASEENILNNRALWLHVYDRVEARQMPPPLRKSLPSADERAKLLSYIEGLFKLPDPSLGQVNPGRPVLRRLTRLEYNNSVRHLLGLEQDLVAFPERVVFDKTYFRPESGNMGDKLKVSGRAYGGALPVLLRQAGLPGDNRAENGFRNRGDTMNFSSSLLEKYLSVTGEIVNHPELARRSPVFAQLLGVSATTSEKRKNESPSISSIAIAQTYAAAGSSKERLHIFLKHAFRRPPTQDEKNQFTGLYESLRAKGQSEPVAMRSTLQAVLASPTILFLAEAERPNEGTVRPLDGYELASRLSYFLWASTPDAALLNAAEAGALEKPAGIVAQARRMMQDAKIREMSESFGVQWLRMDQIHSSRPDQKIFKIFYKGNETLHNDTLIEALLLFETVLVEDRSILEFVDADYTWLNVPLMKLYGLESHFQQEIASITPPPPPAGSKKKAEIPGNIWFRCRLPDRTRGGFLTMSSTLMTTSFPTRTSPVRRGAWLLESIINRPPPEPKVAFVLKEGVKPGEKPTTVRQLFEQHRTDAACYSCHVRLDPPGFAMESFDAVGRWRDVDAGVKVDSSGEWDGRPFQGPAEFKTALLADKQLFVRGFVEHMLSYAIGRKLEYYDRPAVAEIVAEVEAADYRFSSVIAGIVKSRPFRFISNQTSKP